MNESSAHQLDTRTPEKKFYPPQLDPQKHLPRTRILRDLLNKGALDVRTILIEGQAGHGKSLFATHLLAHIKAEFLWYQLGPEDGDTAMLIAALLSGLKETVPAFGAPLLEEMLGKGEAALCEPVKLCALLFEGLNKRLSRDLYLVLDDIYLLDGYPKSLALLGELLQQAPSRLKFIFISRQSILPAINISTPPGRVLVVDNDRLAFTKSEIATLFTSVFKIPISIQNVTTLHHATEGWIMGLTLAGQAITKGVPGEESERLSSFTALGQKEIVEYFHSQVFNGFTDEEQTTLLRFSLLDTIPVSLANDLTKGCGGEQFLASLVRQNMFIRPLDAEGREYVFHHFFRDYLDDQAQKNLSATDIQRTYLTTANWYRKHNQSIEALDYLLRAGDYSTAEALLREVGLELQWRNLLGRLQKPLGSVPNPLIQSYPWFGYFFGVILLESNPPAALAHLEESRKGFARHQDEVGELLATTQLVYFFLMFDIHFNRVEGYLGRLEELFPKVCDDLNLPLRAHTALFIASGNAWVRWDLPVAERFSKLALELARQGGLENLTALAMVPRMVVHILGGKFRPCAHITEESLPLLRSPRVSEGYRMSIQVMHAKQLLMAGNLAGYEHHKAQLTEAISGNLLAQSIFGPLLLLWDATTAIGRGDYDAAQAMVDQGLRTGYVGATPHMRSMYLEGQAYLQAKAGKVDEAQQAIDESQRLRREVGGGFFVILNRIFSGAAYTLLQRTAAAEENLGEAIELAAKINHDYLLAAAHAHRAFARQETVNQKGAIEDVRTAISLLKKHGYSYFYGWSPTVMGPVLSTAVRHHVEADFSRELAQTRLGISLLADGSSIPLLRIRTLGGLVLETDDGSSLSARDLSSTQRQLLALLLEKPDLGCSQEEICAALWPESSQEKGRATFDTLVSRLRRVLVATFGAVAGKSYLCMQKGFLYLDHCRVDWQLFKTQAAIALKHIQRDERWQADNVFRLCVPLWQGEFLAGLPIDDCRAHFRHQLNALYLECVHKWGLVLTDANQVSEAIAIAETALDYDPANDRLVRQLYRLYIRKGQSPRAGQVLQSYQKALSHLEYSPGEISDILESLWSTPG